MGTSAADWKHGQRSKTRLGQATSKLMAELMRYHKAFGLSPLSLITIKKMTFILKS
jgi:hypothetical protein